MKDTSPTAHTYYKQPTYFTLQCLYIVYTAHGIPYLQSAQAGGINTQGTLVEDAACLHFIITEREEVVLLVEELAGGSGIRLT